MEMNLNKVDEAYELKMTAFELDCNNGKGEAMACHQVGEFFSVVKDNHKKAAKVYHENCHSKNYAPSCFNLGRLNLAGRGLPQNDAEAEVLFEKACKGDHLAACHHQALLMYLSAKSKKSSSPNTDEKFSSVLKLMKDNCEKGQPESCYFSGSYLIDPKLHSDRRDPVKASALFKNGCDLNHGPSCFNLAVLYNKGDVGITPDPKLFEIYKEKTNQLVQTFGGLNKGIKTT